MFLLQIGSSLSTPSQYSTCCKAEFLLTSNLPNTSLFQSLIFRFISFILVVSLKLALPLTTVPYHHPRRRSLKPSTLSHIFSNLNGEGPRLNPPPSSKMGKWSEVGLGSLLWNTPLNWSSQFWVTRNLSSLVQDWLFQPPFQVSNPPCKERSTSPSSSTIRANLLIAPVSLPCLLLSLWERITLKSPLNTRGSSQMPLIAPSSSHKHSLSSLENSPYTPVNIQTHPSSTFLSLQEIEKWPTSNSSISSVLLSQQIKIPPKEPEASKAPQSRNLLVPKLLTTPSDIVWIFVSWRQNNLPSDF